MPPETLNAVQIAKAELRRRVLQTIAGMPEPMRSPNSAQACARLERQRAWTEAGTILFYAPLPQELDVWPLLLRALAAGKVAALPRFLPAENRYVACRVEDPITMIQSGRYGIREPLATCPEIELNRLDFVLVPGVAFDLHGGRLGRGKGYYDALLRSVHGKACGVGFEEQIVSEVPLEGHDIHLSCILTPRRWIEL